MDNTLCKTVEPAQSLGEDPGYFQAGLACLVDELYTMAIVVYGSTPDTVFAKYMEPVLKFCGLTASLRKPKGGGSLTGAGFHGGFGRSGEAKECTREYQKTILFRRYSYCRSRFKKCKNFF